jgi:hypothetical protein
MPVSSAPRAPSPGELDQLMRVFYEVISFPEGGEPDYARMASVFSEHARITRITPEGTDYLTLSGFRSMVEELVEVGAFTSFYEHELARRVDAFGDLMHVASAYESKASPEAADHIERGINSLQLIRESGVWKILSLCWDVRAPFAVDGMHLLSRGEGPNDGQS